MLKAAHRNQVAYAPFFGSPEHRIHLSTDLVKYTLSAQHTCLRTEIKLLMLPFFGSPEHRIHLSTDLVKYTLSAKHTCLRTEIKLLMLPFLVLRNTAFIYQQI